MKFTLRCAIAAIFAATLFTGCTTDDVGPNHGKIDPADLYEITDEAFADYLIYNCNRTDDYQLPFGTALVQDGRKYINKKVASRATILYLVKDATRITDLTNAGVPTAATKIVSLDGIQYFTGLDEIRLTSNLVAGELDLRALTRLTTLEMNTNVVNSLLLPATMVRLRYNASSTNSDVTKKIAAIDLSGCANINHISLTNQNIAAAGFTLPATYANLHEIDLTGNPGAPFAVPAALYDQLTTSGGVMPAGANPTTYPALFFQVPDAAFADYIFYRATDASASDKLPAGSVMKHTDNKIYICKPLAATATVLNVAKTSAAITTLTGASVPTASTKIADADGLQFFTGLKEFTATSNTFTAALKLSALTALETLQINTAYVSTLDVSANTKLKTLNCAGSTASGATKLSSINLSTNTKIETLNLKNNAIPAGGITGLDGLTSMTSVDLSGNTGAPFTIPAAIYDQCTTKVGVQK